MAPSVFPNGSFGSRALVGCRGNRSLNRNAKEIETSGHCWSLLVIGHLYQKQSSVDEQNVMRHSEITEWLNFFEIIGPQFPDKLSVSQIICLLAEVTPTLRYGPLLIIIKRMVL
jgi:hypothetical protein